MKKIDLKFINGVVTRVQTQYHLAIQKTLLKSWLQFMKTDYKLQQLNVIFFFLTFLYFIYKFLVPILTNFSSSVYNNQVPIYYSEDFNQNKTNILHGIKAFFQIDVQFCRKIQTQLAPVVNITCFSEIESIASYLGVATAKNVMNDVCFKINSVEATAYKLPKQPTQIQSNYLIFLCIAFITLFCMTVAYVINRKQKRKISAPIFKPTSLIHSNN